MERESNCIHVLSSSFAGLSELSAKLNVGGPLTSHFVDDASCCVCDFSKCNLWVCLHSKCSSVLCGESHKDHSSDHYQENSSHCLHINLTSVRIWCYECNSEVYPLNNKPPLTKDDKALFITKETHFSENIIDNGLSKGIVGLQNLGNTCYMNAALQALSNIQPMTQYFLECMHTAEREKDSKRTSLSKAYQNLILGIWSEHPPPSLAPTSVLYAIKLAFQMFRGYQQHDSQEFLRCFMDQLHEELKEPIEVPYESHVKREPEEDSEHSESESYLTCDSGVSDDEGSTTSSSSMTMGNQVSRKRTRSLSENEFSDALDRSPSPRTTLTEPVASSVKFRSIVSDLFDGRILSSVECLTCNLISSRVETFQDLSLPIPSRDQLHVIHQSVPQASQSENQGWVSWAVNMIWAWFWGPSGRLNDCLSAFFSADELKGDNMYSCEKCKKLRNGVKFSSIIELPEILTIHLKRFRHEPMFSSKISSHIAFPVTGLDMKPWISRECTSKTTVYDLAAVIVHHGTAGGGHYTCYAFNEATSQWIEFDDSTARPVSIETVASCQAYVLFYRKKRNQEMLDFSEHYAKQALQGVGPQRSQDDGLMKFYISNQWFCKFKTFAEPGPINNQDFLCPHGGVQPLKVEYIDDACTAVTAKIWEALYARFGGGPACNRLYTCTVCQHAQQMMDKRRKEELETFVELQKDFQSEKSSVPLYAISMSWFRKWEQFVKNRESPPPGPVDNLPITIMRSGNRILRPSSDFAQLSSALWHLFYSRYGGGPEILIRS